MAGISSKALKPNYVENKFKFNAGTESNSDFDISLYETKFQGYDPQIGRFNQIDPLSEVSNNWSPYTYTMDDPILFNDPLGLVANQFNGPQNITGWVQDPNGKVYFDPNVHKQSDLPAGAGTYLGEEIIIKDGNGNVVGFGNDQGTVSYNVNMENVTVTATRRRFNNIPILYGSFFNGDISNTDAINVGLGFGGYAVNQLQANLINYKNNELLPKAIRNGFNSFYRRELKNVNLGLTKLDKISKRLGYAGLALQGANLTDKYFNGDGITKKDAFDAGVSIVLTIVAITNPVGLIAVGVYGLLDAFGVFDSAKEAIGANDDVILKR